MVTVTSRQPGLGSGGPSRRSPSSAGSGPHQAGAQLPWRLFDSADEDFEGEVLGNKFRPAGAARRQAPLQVHRGRREAPLCDVCDKSFAQAADLKKHSRNTTTFATDPFHGLIILRSTSWYTLAKRSTIVTSAINRFLRLSVLQNISWFTQVRSATRHMCRN